MGDLRTNLSDGDIGHEADHDQLHARFNSPAKLLYQMPATVDWSTYNQVVGRILLDDSGYPACGKVTAATSMVIIEVDAAAQNYGGAWAPIELQVGVTAAAADVPLQAPLTYPQTAAAGVTEWQRVTIGHIPIDSDGAVHRRVFLTGLTPGREYTWQLVTAIEATSTEDVLAASPAFGRIAVSPDNNWLAVALTGSNQVQLIRLGARPAWHFAAGVTASNEPVTTSGVLGQFYSAVQAPIGVGSGPGDVKFSPDSTKLAVANYTAGTITFINVKTGAVIGTSAVLSAGKNATCLAWLADGSGVLAFTSDSNYYEVTAVASPVVTHPGNFGGQVPNALKRKDKTTNSFWAVTNTLIVPGTLASDTSAWVNGNVLTPTGATGISKPAIDGSGNLWAGIASGTYDKQVVQATWGAASDGSLAAIGAHYTPGVGGYTASVVATPNNGKELWIITARPSIMAIQTSDGAVSQGEIALPSFEHIHGQAMTTVTDIAQSADGSVYFSANAADGTGWIHEWPSSTLRFAGQDLVSGHITVSAVGVE